MVKKYKIKLYKSPIYKRFESVMKNKRRGCTAIVWCSLFLLLYEKKSCMFIASCSMQDGMCGHLFFLA